jgi:hypothetical protein
MDNLSKYNGGGVHVKSGGNYSGNGGTISGNKTGSGSVSGGGSSSNGGVYLFGSSSFIMSLNASVDTGNAVYHYSDRVITLSGTLTANPAANIVTIGTEVLGGDITLDDNYKKFWLDGVSNADGDKIGADGKIL